MAILCPDCGRQYDVTLFQFGNEVACECGGRVSARAPHRPPPEAPGGAGGSEGPTDRERLREFQREADRVSGMILDEDLPWVDVAIAIERLRELAEEWFPGRGEFFEIVYESRFRRLREQFRREG